MIPWTGKHRTSSSITKIGCLIMAPKAPAVQTHRQKVGLIPIRAAIAKLRDIPEKIMGKNLPPFHPKEMHTFSTMGLMAAVRIRLPMPMAIQWLCSNSDWASPANKVFGSRQPAKPKMDPAIRAFIRGRLPSLSEAFSDATPDTWQIRPRMLPASARGTSRAHSALPASKPSKRGMPLPPPNRFLSSSTAPREDAMAMV